MLSYLTFFNVTLFALLLPLLIFIIFFILIPVLRLKSYQKEGTLTYFFPIIGNMKTWFENAHEYGDILADPKRMSSLYTDQTKLSITNFNTRLFFGLIDTQYIKAFVQNPHLYVKSPMIDWTKILMKNGLLIIEDDAWKRHRRIISSSFHYEFLKPHVAIIQDTTREFLDKIPKSEYTNFEVLSKMKEITGEMVGRIFFGEHLNDYTFEGKPLTIALAEITAETGMTTWDPLVVLFGIKILDLPIPKYRRMIVRMKEFRKLCFKIVADRKSKPQQSNDLLAALLATQTSEDVEKRLSDEEIIDEFLMFFIAGMDTTSQMIGMALYMLAQHPQYLKDLKEERDTLYNKTSRVSAEEVQKMEVLHSVIKESLRFYTPGPGLFARIAKTDHKILDLQIRKGDLVVPSLIASAYNSNNFKNPQEFNPERWRSADISKVDPYAFIPFSAGPRNCIGQHLAMIEAKIIISEFLNKFEFKLKDGYKLKMTFKFVYEPEKPFYFELSPIKDK